MSRDGPNQQSDTTAGHIPHYRHEAMPTIILMPITANLSAIGPPPSFPRRREPTPAPDPDQRARTVGQSHGSKTRIFRLRA